VALDSAIAYGKRASDMARASKSRALGMYLDTYAYALYKNGNAKQAEAIQCEAIVGHENEADYVYRLALYEAANGKTREALKTVSRALLLGHGDEACSSR